MKNGTCWLDDQGKLIQAHGGMIIKFGDLYYWYGENKDGPNCIINGQTSRRVDVIGVSCYTSSDLHTWHYEGLALKATQDDPNYPLHFSRVLERPKVLYCEKTGKYVMWFHADSANYQAAQAGCAIADDPKGPFTFLHAKCPNGRDCRDMTFYFSPEDGKAYIIHSGDRNKTMYASQLNDEYTDFTGVCYPMMPDQTREAPALIYHEGKHYCVTSGCTGWDPNSALYSVTPHLSNGMKLIDNPCEGPNYRRTFEGQSTYIFEAEGKAYLMLDHWKRYDLKHSGYSILPITFDAEGIMTVHWQDEF